MIGTDIHSKRLASLLNQYTTSHNEALKAYTVDLAYDYIKGSEQIMAILTRNEGSEPKTNILEAIKDQPEYFERQIELLIRYIDQD